MKPRAKGQVSCCPGRQAAFVAQVFQRERGVVLGRWTVGAFYKTRMEVSFR